MLDFGVEVVLIVVDVDVFCFVVVALVDFDVVVGLVVVGFVVVVVAFVDFDVVVRFVVGVVFKVVGRVLSCCKCVCFCVVVVDRLVVVAAVALVRRVDVVALFCAVL